MTIPRTSHRAFLFLLFFLISPTVAVADENLQEALESEIKAFVIERSAYNLLHFRSSTLSKIFVLDRESQQEADYINLVLSPLIADAVLSKIENGEHRTAVFVVDIEKCGSGYGIGLPDNIPLSGPNSLSEKMFMPRQWALIDQTRLKNAFSEHNIDFNLSLYEVGLLREEIESDRLTDSRPNLKNLNNRLYDLFISEKLESLYQVLDYSEGCGDGWVDVTLKVSPDIGSVYVIPDFYFRVCQKVYKDPWDRSACTFWEKANETNPFSGTYRWQGVTSTSSRQEGEFSVTADFQQIIEIP